MRPRTVISVLLLVVALAAPAGANRMAVIVHADRVVDVDLEAIRRFVADDRRAIGYVDARVLDDSVRVVLSFEAIPVLEPIPSK